MLQKVKKFRDKIFNSTKDEKKDRDLGTLEIKPHNEDEACLRTHSFGKKASFSSNVTRKNSNDCATTDTEGVASRKNSSQALSFSKKHNNLGMNPQLSSSQAKIEAKGPVPAVQVNGSKPNPLTGIMPPSSTGRRKSTPAALDMALRTAEGRAAIEELVSPGKKQMVFGQYFGAGANAATDAKASSITSPKGSSGRLPKLPHAVLAQPEVEFDRHNITTVPEDEDHMPEMSNAAEHAKKSKGIVDSVSSLTPTDASHTASPVAPTSPVTPVALVAPKQQQVVVAPKPAKSVKTEEEEPPAGKRTKILTMSSGLPTGMARKYWNLSDYSIVRKMYTGYASTVYQATCKKSLDQVALKVYHMENLCELNHYQVYREIRVHASLQHQNIIHLYAAFQEGTDVVLVQEYAEGGDLYRLLHKNGGRLSERQAVEMVLHPFLLALHYLHTRGIMHRDIKPENVLFTEHRVLKLADFGLAIDLNEERAVTRAGTLDYMAPEVLRCPPKNLPQENKQNVNLHYNNSVDAWAVGVFAYELIVGIPPFAGDTQLDSVERIMHSTPDFPEKISELAKAFICQALKKHPGDRPTVMEMIHHAWIRTYQRRTSMLHIPSSQRRRSSSIPYTLPPGMSPYLAAPLPVEALEGADSNAAQADDLSPEQIETMIRKLQVAKAQAIERMASGNISTKSSGNISTKPSAGSPRGSANKPMSAQ